MPISITQYVNIQSGLGAAISVAQRQFVGRFFTTNNLVPPYSFVSFDNAAQVGAYFGVNFIESGVLTEGANTVSGLPSTINLNVGMPVTGMGVPANTVVASIVDSGDITLSQNALASGTVNLTFQTVEYLRAVYYFSYQSKNITSPTSLQFARWVNSAVPPMIFGNVPTVAPAVSTFAAISDGSFGLTIVSALGTQYFNISSLDFESGPVASLADVAAVVQEGINAAANYTMTGTIADTMNTVTGLSSTAGMNVGDGVSGTDIPSDTTIASIVNSTSITLSASATGSATESLTFSPVQWYAATVFYDSVRGSFDFIGGQAIASTITVQAGVGGTDISQLLGWIWSSTYSPTSTLIISNGQVAETPVQSFMNSVQASNNFGSFLFVSQLTLMQAQQLAAFNQTFNVDFMYLVPVGGSVSPTTWQAGLIGYEGVGLTNSLFNVGVYEEQIPSMIWASTNYNANNSVQNYMFQMVPATPPSVTDDVAKSFYDNLSINYYGQTENAGQLLSFYQTGVLCGTGTAPTDMNVYANEAWLKDAITAQIMTLLLSVAQVPANQQGTAQLLAIIQSAINQAVLNGTISSGKILTPTQQLYIAEQTGDPNAWYQVQTLGYWVNVVISLNVDNEYVANYVLIYSKDDTIRMVNGTDILI